MYNLDYLKSLDYRFIVEKDSFENETWYIAYAEELGKKACFGEADTPEEAVRCFYQNKEDFIEMLYNLGKKIPEPEPPIDYSGCNGNISVRTTPQTHAQLLREAKRANTSLNLYINNLLHASLNADSLNIVLQKIAIVEKKLDSHHRYAETKKINYDKGLDLMTTLIDPYADATEYWLNSAISK